ncbi:MAG: GNAT family N-acetyltransferase [Sandaracinaceae bacterium]
MTRTGAVEVGPLRREEARAAAAVLADAGLRGWGPADLAAEQRRDGEAVVVARCGGHLLGSAILRTVADEGEVLTVAVVARARGRGVGRRLVSALLATARRRRLQRVHLEVADHNLAARRLYAGLGFAVVGRRPGYYPDGADAVLMAWRPAPGSP